MVQRAGALLFSILIMFLFLPKEGLFKYEYQLHQPWKHDRLIAPFDFGVRKSEAELEQEADQIRERQATVFSIDAIQTTVAGEALLRTWDEQYTDTVHPCDSVRQKSYDWLLSTMQSGILRQGEETKSLQPFDQVLIERNGRLVKEEFRNILTIQTLYDSIQRWGDVEADSACVVSARKMLSQHLSSNLLFNDSITQRLVNAELENIIDVRGKINVGQAIIDQGEIVDEKTYQVLESLKLEYQDRTISSTQFQWSLLGEMGVIVILLGLLMLFVYIHQDRVFNDPRPVTLSLALVTISFVICSLAYTSKAISVYAIPIGIAPLLLRMFFDFRLSIFAFLILTLEVALFSKNPLEFTIVQTSAISFATLYQAQSTKRSRMLGTALMVFVGYSVIYTCVSLAQNGSLNGIETENFGWFAINGFLCTLVFPLIYVVEKLFGYISETTLLELSDSNQPLLKDLAVKAPGTFQHSMQVANLCEKVASSIGGNSVLLRTAAMYHDIGKMNDPQFFIENQIPDNNPHDDLEPDESAYIIISHVNKGVELALDHKLPIDIIQFIQTHHGTSKVQYFLKRAREKSEDVNELDFRYPGPRPKTKEQAILMMADSVEAASRSLKKYDQESLENLIDGIIDYQRNEGQFEEAPITFKDISEAKKVLKKALKGIYHQRISYD